jgi:hypothetical protein
MWALQGTGAAMCIGLPSIALLSHPRPPLASIPSSYKHWRKGTGAFYEGLPQRLEFERYSKQFNMVELNATFYGCGLRRRSTIAGVTSALLFKPLFKATMKHK